ncbi:MAG: hypothetical protein EAY72_07380 [Bacteroidetes bacterium]|nr:MAG: hypothetical protein EAY72_07380 [Bacteroidota bacterium]TAE67746.1 MAG: hypothetical protein EAY68_05040 [Bacteroidota bacterium]
MMALESIALRGTAGVKVLREQKLKSGLPFMINVEELESNQCYLEYPNGVIKLFYVEQGNKEMNFLRELTAFEASELRRQLQFPDLF